MLLDVENKGSTILRKVANHSPNECRVPEYVNLQGKGVLAESLKVLSESGILVEPDICDPVPYSRGNQPV
jgi:hypothetical protein